MRSMLPFGAGFLATLLFHQGLIALLHAAGAIPFGAWNMTPTWPLAVLQVVSLAFWGGVRGIVLAAPIGRRRGLRWWGGWVLLGAIAPTAIALLVVLPLKGIPMTATAAVLGPVLNGFRGLGTAILLDAFRRLLRSLQ